MKTYNEQWTVKQGLVHVVIMAENGRPVSSSVNDEDGRAYAKRAVDCVNACAGLNPEAVPDLLEALKDTLHMLNTMTSEDFGKGKDRPIRERLESLLSKAKEEE